jgi:hypothetical protein
MKIKNQVRVALQSLLATFFVALIVVGIAQAATTIGNNISTGTLTTSGIADLTASSDTVLTVNGSTSSTTLAVYQASTGDIVNVFDSQTEVFTILDGGKIGVGSTTPNAVFSVEATHGSPAFTVGSSTNGVHNDLLSIAENGALTFNTGGAPESDVTLQGDSLNNLFTLDASADRVGIASSTPWALFAIEQSTETYSFITMNQGSTTPSFVVNGVNGDGKVGIASSSPSAMLGIGSGTATSTIDVGKVCYRAQTDKDTTIYWWWTTEGGGPAIASSTTSCF